MEKTKKALKKANKENQKENAVSTNSKETATASKPTATASKPTPTAAATTSKPTIRKPKDKCFNCNEPGHKMNNCPKASKGKKCYICNKFGHISKACSEAKGSDNEDDDDELPQVTLLLNTNNEFSVTANIDGIDVYCQISTATTCNLLQEEIWKRIAREGATKYTLDTKRRMRLKRFNSYIYPLGRVKMPMKISGVTYSLDWAVVPDDSIPVKACIGTPLLRHASLSFSANKLAITPNEVNPNPDVEELVQREIQKIKDDVNKRTHEFMDQQKKYIAEQVEKVMSTLQRQSV